jgi:hypothetical protein
VSLAGPSIAPVLADLGRRAELVSMDRHFQDITIALYRARGAAMSAVIHSYSTKAGTQERLGWLAEAMAILGGMRVVPGPRATVAFACGTWHDLAARRVFLEAAKVTPPTLPEPRPMHAEDTRRGFQIDVESLGDGRYRVGASGGASEATNPAESVAAGLAKLGELSFDPDDPLVVEFGCRTNHDILVGLLLPRALNVRAALREQEMAAGRGVLLAPSAQDAPPA